MKAIFLERYPKEKLNTEFYYFLYLKSYYPGRRSRPRIISHVKLFVSDSVFEKIKLNKK